jgi:hypothetical protein
MSEYSSGGSVAQPTRKEPSVWEDRDAAWRQSLAGCTEGDQTALGSLYDQSSALVYSIALRMLADPGDAEEVLSTYIIRSGVPRAATTVREAA